MTYEEYKVSVADFVKRFIRHNTVVKLFTRFGIANEDGVREWEYILVWEGMDWQVAEDYPSSSYYAVHPDVEPCPYSKANVASVTSFGLSGEFADEASLIIELLDFDTSKQSGRKIFKENL